MNYRDQDRYPKLDMKLLHPYIKVMAEYGKDITKKLKTGEPHFNLNFTTSDIKRELGVLIDINNLKITLGVTDIALDTTPCNYGSVRYWFRCPYCYSRKRTLYYIKGKWACRECFNLVYSSQQITKGDYWEWYFKAQKIARLIDENFDVYSLNPGFDGLWWTDFPDKPKYMKWHKYEELRLKFKYYADIGNKLMAKSFEAITKRLNIK